MCGMHLTYFRFDEVIRRDDILAMFASLRWITTGMPMDAITADPVTITWDSRWKRWNYVLGTADCKMTLYWMGARGTLEGPSVSLLSHPVQFLSHQQDTVHAEEGCVEIQDFCMAALMFLTSHGIKVRIHALEEITHVTTLCIIRTWKVLGMVCNVVPRPR